MASQSLSVTPFIYDGAFEISAGKRRAPPHSFFLGISRWAEKGEGEPAAPDNLRNATRGVLPAVLPGRWPGWRAVLALAAAARHATARQDVVCEETSSLVQHHLAAALGHINTTPRFRLKKRGRVYGAVHATAR